jgi:hypothetical protein
LANGTGTVTCYQVGTGINYSSQVDIKLYI